MIPRSIEYFQKVNLELKGLKFTSFIVIFLCSLSNFLYKQLDKTAEKGKLLKLRFRKLKIRVILLFSDFRLSISTILAQNGIQRLFQFKRTQIRTLWFVNVKSRFYSLLFVFILDRIGLNETLPKPAVQRSAKGLFSIPELL